MRARGLDVFYPRETRRANKRKRGIRGSAAFIEIFSLLVAQVFDKHNRGYITASDLRAVLQCLGEDLSEEESEYLMLMHLHQSR